MKVYQPDIFFPLLARHVSLCGSWSCDSVAPQPGGILVFSMKKGRKKSQVLWSVPTPLLGQTPYRDGSIEENPESGTSPQVMRALNALFAKYKPPLLEKRNRNIEAVYLRPEIAERMMPGFLQPGQTQFGLFTLQRLFMKSGRLHLVFTHSARELCEFFIAAAGDYSGAAVAAPATGPLQLFAVTPTKLHESVRHVVNCLAYVMALCFHSGMRICSSNPGQILNNTFFGDDSLEENNIFRALFGCHGNIRILADFDRECAATFLLLNGPWTGCTIMPWNVSSTVNLRRNFHFTDISDLTAIMSGGEQKFRSVLQTLCALRNTDAIFLFDSCVSKLIGDDIDAILDDIKAELSDLPIMRLSLNVSSPPDDTQQLWRDLITCFSEGTAATQSGRSINLIGYCAPRTREARELEDLLKSIQIDLNACVIPTFDVTELKRFSSARLNVIYPSKTVEGMFKFAAKECSAPLAHIPPPYGFQDTQAWLRAIASCLQIPMARHETGFQASRNLQEQWGELTHRARLFRAGVVILDSHFLTGPSPDRRNGVPLFNLLDEMCMGIDLLVIRTPDEWQLDTGEGLARIESFMQKLNETNRHQIHIINSDAELREILKRGEFDIVYTEIVRDRRVSSSGKAPFSFQDFEMGYHGSVRTAARLIQLCETPFYKICGQYLLISS